jgi:glucose dehydrogenase
VAKSGTMRGFEGQPLVIGDMMYFETPYPNYIYAINLDNPDRMVQSTCRSFALLTVIWSSLL